MKSVKKIICFSVSAIILAIVLALNIAVGVFSETIDRNVIGYKQGENASALRAEGAALVEQIQYEGTVLVQNNDDTLPLSLSGDEVINVFGWASVDWVYSGSGSGRVKGTKDRGDDTQTQLYDLYDALYEYGIEYNTELKSMYEGFKGRRDYAEPLDKVNPAAANTGTLHSFNYEFSKLYEPSISDKTYYSDSLLANAKKNDTALVVIGRVSGESNDSPKVQYKKNSSSDAVVTDDTRTYLEISTEEEELLTYVGANYENVVVIINSTNVMELGFLETIPGLDACLIVGTTGTSGALAIPKMLCGEYTPSGRLADTYAYDLSTSSTYVNTGSGIKGKNGQGEDTTNFYTNGSGLYPAIGDGDHNQANGSSQVPYSGVAYTDYVEGIYVGYKWYETADQMGFWDSQKAKTYWNIENGYSDVVQYPFGFGLSYTDFKWEILSVSHGNGSTVTEDDGIEIQVEVTNTGNYPGQDVVQLYYSAPYTYGGIEKPSVNLVAFGKTLKVLAPGESEIVTLDFKVEDMKSYDYNDANGNGFSGYELEKGDYVISLRTDAHTLATDRLGEGNETLTYVVANDIQIVTDSASGNTVENRFTGADTTDGVAIDGNSDGSVGANKIKYLTRWDIENTFPFQQAENREMTDIIKKYNLYTEDLANQWDEAHKTQDILTNQPGEKVYADGALTEIGMLIGDPENYDNDAIWDYVLNQLSYDEMQKLVLHGHVKTMPLDSIGKPKTIDLDGPNQIGSFEDTEKGHTGFSSIVLAQSWNDELAYSMGLALARESAENGISGWYGPAINLHRSPFGGRNYEYYSEDAYLSGIMSARAVKAAKNAGVYSYLKHLCLYESESCRDGMYVWLTEQALRETYVKPFEICVKEGEATGIMTSYGRIGAIWTGGSEALLTELVRGEWGFKGAFLTDYSDHRDFMNGSQMVRAGGDLWMDGWAPSGDGPGEFTVGSTTSTAFKQAVRNANKHVIYMWANALWTNADYNAKIASGEITEGVQIQIKEPELNFRWYIPTLIAIDVAAVGGCGVWIFFTVRKKKI